MFKDKKILCVSPHADDSEHGCGASMSRFLEEGAEVHYVSFSFGLESIPEWLPRDTTKKEFDNAMIVLGISNITTFDYPVRCLPAYRQDILEDLVKLNKKIKPDLVFVPSSYDRHQDHNTLYNEVFRAFRTSCILGYEMPRNNTSFDMGFFISVEERHMNTKIKAVECYKSQTSRSHYNINFLLALSKVRGYQIGSEYAECFEPIRYIVR